MATINGLTKEQHYRRTALAILEDTSIPTVVNSSGHSLDEGYIFMEPIKKRSVKIEFRVTEDYRGWVFQYRKNTEAEWQSRLRGSWLNTHPLFEAIDRRRMIADAQAVRLVKQAEMCRR